MTICNVRGLHARAAAKFVALVNTFDARIQLRRDQEIVDADSIMDLLMLAAGPGTKVTLLAQGDQSELAISALAKLVEDGFDETD